MVDFDEEAAAVRREGCHINIEPAQGLFGCHLA